MVHGVSEGALVVERGVDDGPRKLADVYWPNTDTPAPPALNPAPVMAQHTRSLCQSILELSDADIDQLAEDGVLELAQGPKE